MAAVRLEPAPWLQFGCLPRLVAAISSIDPHGSFAPIPKRLSPSRRPQPHHPKRHCCHRWVPSGDWQALRVYGQYLSLDTDQNGMLSKSELMRWAASWLLL